MAITPTELEHLLNTFDWTEWGEQLRVGVEQHYRDILIDQGQRVGRDNGFVFNQQDPMLAKHFTTYIGERIVTLQGTTKQDVIDLIRDVLQERTTAGAAGTAFDLGTAISDRIDALYSGYKRWRCDRIARTETGFAYNHGTVLAAKQAGFTHVDVTDGDDDEPCKSANGAVWTIEQAQEKPLGHPNCTRAFAPHVEDAKPEPEIPVAPPPAPLPRPSAPPPPDPSTMDGAALRAHLEAMNKGLAASVDAAEGRRLRANSFANTAEETMNRARETWIRQHPEWDGRMPQWQSDPNYIAAKKAYETAVERLIELDGLAFDANAKRTKALRDALKVPPSERVRVRVNYRRGKFDATTNARIEDALEELHSWTAKASGIPEDHVVTITKSRTARAFASKVNGINISAQTGSAVVVHETGHLFEFFGTGVRAKVAAFFDKRTVGEVTVQLRRLFPGRGYKVSEITKRDKWVSPYTGKVYPASWNCSEVVSMGVQHLYEDPLAFARQDPEFFDFIVNLLRGK